ncbi:MAG: NAD-dependent epimerase/dehydratase family protein [Alphaproteobacteria bacterium]|nr:NAD-dependent epimerase/dehydratase family protein [Alphaproteobacteria bacterium]
MRILVTGGTGFLGRHVIERLRHGNEVVALCRRAQDELGVPVVVGDITDAATLAGVAEGCQALIHMAGLVSHHPEDAQRLYDLHVRGTENVLAEARRAGVRRVVHLSTSGTVAVSADPDQISDERTETPRDIIYRWPYYRTKLIAEEAALEASARDLQVVSLNPSWLLGPGDRTGASSRIVRMFLDDQVPAAPPGGLSFADVRDVAATVETALYKGRPGSRYLLGSANMTLMAFYERLARLTGKRPPLIKAPSAIRRALELFPRFGRDGVGFGFVADRVDVEQACHTWYVDDTRARVELGWSPRDPTATLRDTVADILEQASGFRSADGYVSAP